MINSILQSLKIKGECKGITDHRHYRLYDIELAPGQSLRKLESHVREIGLALRSLNQPAIIPIPERGIVRLQTTARKPNVLWFDKLYESCKNDKPEGLLQFLVGEQNDGAPVWIDFAKAPHMLVAGGTGSGKSSFLHTIIANCLKRDDIWLYLADPKHGVEFYKYEDYANVIVHTYDETVSMLENLHADMEQRYELFRKLGIKNIAESPFVAPKIMVIIDEVADLMLRDKDKKNPNRGQFERLLIGLAQKSRAVGIHIILATQRPSVDVLTGLIKANFPSRLACKVSSSVDSKVIIDQAGAENLGGRGEAILNHDNHYGIRFQVAFSS